MKLQDNFSSSSYWEKAHGKTREREQANVAVSEGRMWRSLQVGLLPPWQERSPSLWAIPDCDSMWGILKVSVVFQTPSLSEWVTKAICSLHHRWKLQKQYSCSWDVDVRSAEHRWVSSHTRQVALRTLVYHRAPNPHTWFCTFCSNFYSPPKRGLACEVVLTAELQGPWWLSIGLWVSPAKGWEEDVIFTIELGEKEL